MNSKLSLRWNNYNNQLTDAFGSLLLEEDLVDVTLSCEGKKIKAHKMLLSACSPYFHNIFKENLCQHPVIVFQNVQFADLKAIVEYIYCGEVNVLQEQLESFLGTAEMLEVKGLTDKGNESVVEGYISETSLTDKDYQENVQIDIVQEQQINKVLKKPVSIAPEAAGPSSPPAKRKKRNEGKPPDVSPAQNEITTVIKEEPEDIDIVYKEEDLDVSKSEDSELFTRQVSSPGLKSLKQGDVAESSESLQDIGQDILNSETAVVSVEPLHVEAIKEPSTEEAVIEITDDPEEDKSIHSQEPVSPDVIIVEPKTTSVPLQKRKNISEENISLEGETPETPGKKAIEAKHDGFSCLKISAQSVKSPLLAKVQIPKDLIVTPIQDVKKVQELFDFPTQEPQVLLQEGAYVALSSEDATTPVHEDPVPYCTSEEIQIHENVPSEQIPEEEPEAAKEGPVLQAEQTEPDSLVEEVPKEPEFDYFGCEICKDEAKPVDIERITFNHKCPICPCACFCSHLLKEHMKIIHGWFNVQRRFTHY